MSGAYVDTSVVVAIAFSEASAAAVTRRLREFDEIVASNLVEAELRSVCRRERRAVDLTLLDEVEWIHPSRPLSEQIARVLEAGYVRGADCWHLATALYIAPDPGEIVFLTLDHRQRDIAKALGFAT